MKRNVFYQSLLPLILCVSLYFGSVSTFAFSGEQAIVHNRIHTGDIDIQIKEYEQTSSGKYPYPGIQTVVPGDSISKIVEILNLASDCWVRAKIDFSTDTLSDTQILGISDHWQKAGSYYYLTEPLLAEESVMLFDQVHIPTEWDSGYSDMDFQIQVTVQAIQKEHFTPDFSSEDPWFGQAIEICTHTSHHSLSETAIPVTFQVLFQDGADRLIASADDFFQNMSDFLPGDSQSDQVTIHNTSGDTRELWFYTGYENQNLQQKDLLQKMQLSLSLNGTPIYQGPLDASALSKGISLGTYAPESRGVLSYTISMPETLGNSYAEKNAVVKWIFRADTQDTSSGNGIFSNYTSDQSSPVRTDDPTSILPWIFLMIIGGIVGIVGSVIVKRRKG